MSLRPLNFGFRFFFIIFAPSLLAGCGGAETVPPASESVTGQRLLKVYTAYKQHIQDKGEPPTKPEDLYSYLKEHGDPLEILSSERDAQSFVIKWGVRLRESEIEAETETESGAGIVLAREVEGKDGQVYAVRGDGSLYERDAEPDEDENGEDEEENE